MNWFRLLLVSAVAVVATSVSAGDGMGKAKEALAKEFKGKHLRLRVDVLEWTPGDARVATTATPTDISYPNAGQPLQFPAFSTVEIDSFWGWNDGIRVSIKAPGYKPRLFSSVMSDSDKQAEMKAMMGYVNLRVGSPDELRAAFARAFMIDGTQLTDAELRRCIEGGRDGESPELTAARCGASLDRIMSIQSKN